MSKDIKIKKGLDLKLKGECQNTLTQIERSKTFAVRPSDFHGVIPKLVVRQGDKVKAGAPLFYSKNDSRIQFVSPVSGEIKEIRRGEKRVILEVLIQADSQDEFVNHGSQNVDQLSSDQLKSFLLGSGCWPFVKQRPYDVIANPDDKPKAIFVSGINSEPLATDLNFTLSECKQALGLGFKALSKLSTNVHLTVDSNSNWSENFEGVKVHRAQGKHPVGLVSTQIAKIDPINKGEKVWVVQIEDVALIGQALKEGCLKQDRLIGLAGTGFVSNHYVKVRMGAQVSDLIKGNLKQGDFRIISGDVLTGDKVKESGFLGFYHKQLTVIPEGDDYDFFGWNRPRPKKFSFYRAAMFSFLTPNKKYDLNTNTNGEHRGFVMTGDYEKVFPLDIFPVQLLKSILVKDIDQMEALGIYEVAPEDFALTEFICVSKQDHQHIVRQGLDLMIKEVG